MASDFITNALQVNFEYVLGISDNDKMVNMFKALESTGLRGFLGCPSVLYEQELEQFFDTTLVQDGDITYVVSGKYVAIPEDRLLNDILAKFINVKAGSFDAVTHERFLMMTSIHFGIKVNWSKILFEVLKEMVDRTTKREKGFAAQICVLSKSDPAVTLGEAKTFPPLKILSAKMVNTYVTTKKTIDARGETDEPEVAKVAIVKNKSVSKNRSVSTAIKDTAEVQMETTAPAVKKKRKTTGKDASEKRDLGLVSVAQKPSRSR
ncbi:short chain dehydrogenase [Dorcoceras hygrometricum]|uniref:Short chain dehydrogenase n=1 Tax=Dorcoceras hygrometricum TaxID=472368 RepID=A0A2Z7AZJ1_9LAMI|nr:short chain dehydrogenase [Dorcoceras hygrometricum]